MIAGIFFGENHGGSVDKQGRQRGAGFRFGLIWLVLYFVLGSTPACAFAPGAFGFSEPYFETLSQSDTIPIVTALAQDAQGFLWIGTQDGLVRFDGYRLRRFAHENNNATSLGGNYINCLWLAADGRLIIGTLDGGLSEFDQASERFHNFKHDAKRADSLSSGPILAVAGNAWGQLWVGTEQGLDYRAPAGVGFSHLRHRSNDPGSLASDKVLSLLHDRHARLWVGTADGLQRLSADGKVFERIGPAVAGANSLVGQEVQTLFEAADGKIWIGTRKQGAFWLAPDSAAISAAISAPISAPISLPNRLPNHLKLHHLPYGASQSERNSYGALQAISQPRPDQIWLGFSGGIDIVSAHDGHTLQRLRHDVSLPGSLALDSIGALLLDRAGLLWIGTWGGGLQRYNARNQAIRLVKHRVTPASETRQLGLSHADVRSMLELANGQILVATQGNGIDILDRQRGLVGGYRAQPGTALALPDANIGALLQMPDGSLWAGTTQAGAVFLPPGASRWQRTEGLPDVQVRKMLLSRSGQLWVATAGGVARWQAAQQRFEMLATEAGTPMKSYVETMVEDGAGRIWIASDAGLWYWQAGAKGLRGFHNEAGRPDSLSSDSVSGLLIDHLGRLWIDTAQGLDRLSNGGQIGEGKAASFEHISELINRPGKSLGANLLEDKLGRIWTSEWLLEPQTMRVHELSKADGLDIGTAWNGSYGKTRDGYLMYGGTKGLALIAPEQFKPWDDQPPVRVTEFKAGGQVWPMGAPNVELKLSPEQRSFTLEFSALDYSNPQKNRYRYRLQGYDKAWQEADAEHRSASYGNLWPGQYRLQVQGSNRNGVWSEHELSIPLRVLPMFWQTGWFVLLLVLLLSSLVFLAYRWRVWRLRAEGVRLQRLIDERTKDILQLGEIGRDLTATLDIEQAFERVYAQVSARLDAHVFCIGIYHRARAHIAFVYEIENGQRQPCTELAMGEYERPAVWCVRERRELITASHGGLLNYVSTILPPSRGAAMETVVYLPLVLDREVIGCISAQSPKVDAYSKDQIEFLRVLASYTAIALSNSSAHGELAAAHQNLQQTQARLIESEKMASLGGLVAGIAHEINTPLGTALMAISGGIQAWERLRSEISGDRVSKTALEATVTEGAEYAALALTTATKAARLVTMFKSIAVSSERDKITVFDLNEYITEGAVLMRSRLARSGSVLETRVEAGLQVEVVAEALTEALRLILTNVVDHAFVEGRSGVLRVTVQTEVHTEAQTAVQNGEKPDEVVIEISDNGHGIAAEHLPKVFEPFFTTKSGVHGHVGLGLYVAYSQVTQRLHGKIEIESCLGQGTTVTIRLLAKRVVGE